MDRVVRDWNCPGSPHPWRCPRGRVRGWIRCSRGSFPPQRSRGPSHLPARQWARLPLSREPTSNSREKQRPPLAAPRALPPPPRRLVRHRVTSRGQRGKVREAEAAPVPVGGGPAELMSVSLVVIRLELAGTSPLPAGFAYSAAGGFPPPEARAGRGAARPGPLRTAQLPAGAVPVLPVPGLLARRPVPTPALSPQLRTWQRRAPARSPPPCPPAWRGRAPGSGRPSCTSTWAAGR